MSDNNALKLLKAPLLASLFFILSWFLCIYLGIVKANYTHVAGINYGELTTVYFMSFAQYIDSLNADYTITLKVMGEGLLANLFHLLYVMPVIFLALCQDKVVSFNPKNNLKLGLIMAICGFLYSLLTINASYLTQYIIFFSAAELGFSLTQIVLIALSTNVLLPLMVIVLVYMVTRIFVWIGFLQTENYQLSADTCCRFVAIAFSLLLASWGVITVSYGVAGFVSVELGMRSFFSLLFFIGSFNLLVSLLFYYCWVLKILPKNLQKIKSKQVVLIVCYALLFFLLQMAILGGLLLLFERVLSNIGCSVEYFSRINKEEMLISILLIALAMFVRLLITLRSMLVRGGMLLLWVGSYVISYLLISETRVLNALIVSSLLILPILWIMYFSIKYAFKPFYREAKG